MTLTAVIIVGVVLLVVLAVCIGVSMDTEAQRQEWRRVAEARRLLRREEQEIDDSGLCQRCPYRQAGA
jgi:hypothetical protein